LQLNGVPATNSRRGTGEWSAPSRSSGACQLLGDGPQAAASIDCRLP
jgi:hypothetical protein